MVERHDERAADTRERFVRSARAKRGGLLREYRDLIRHSRKYWLAPVILVLLIVSAVILLSGTAVAPLLYTLF